MYDNNIFSDETHESIEEATELGLIGAMMDGIIQQFDFRGLEVRSDGEWMWVAHPVSKLPLGGKVHLRNAEVSDTHHWLENKAEHYGGVADGS